jgi:hypothetical protein
MKRMKANKLILCILLFNTINNLYANNYFVKKFGVNEGKAINHGFVFIGGKYVEPPYIISRKGFELYINDIVIKEPIRLPGEKPIIPSYEPEKLSDQQQQILFHVLEDSKRIYEYHLDKNHCYIFSGSRGHIQNDEYFTAYTLKEIIKSFSSGKSKERMLKELTYQNWHLSIDIEEFIDNFSPPPNFLIKKLDKLSEKLLYIDGFKITEGEVINNGFLFIDGKYIDAPYIVTRKGLSLFINDIQVQIPFRWPLPKESSNNIKDPIMPTEISKYSSPFDPLLRIYIQEKVAYLRKFHPQETYAKISKDAYSSLPCVTDVIIEPNSPNLIVTWTNGSTHNINLHNCNRGLHNKEEILKSLETSRKHHEKNLQQGDLVFLGRAGRFSKSNATECLRKIIPILRSVKPTEFKIKELEETDFSHIGRRALENLVLDFKASKQLERRIKVNN